MGMMSEQTSLESIFYKHNLDYRPFARKMRSLSVSDVIVVKDHGKAKPIMLIVLVLKKFHSSCNNLIKQNTKSMQDNKLLM